MERTRLRLMPGLYLLMVSAILFTAASGVYAQNLPPYENLYMIGDASPSGWSITNPMPFQQDAEDPWIFTYSGHMFSGEFKILTFTGGDWCDEEDWIRPPSMHPPLEDTAYIITTGCPPEEEDYKWKLEDQQLSDYTITVNLRDETITIVNNGAINVPYESLYLAGNATTGGWDNPVMMERDENLPWIFRFSGFLLFGEFNVKTFTGDSCDGDWIRPPSNHPPLDNTEYIITKGCLAPALDYRWRITNDQVGDYKITVNLQDETIVITRDVTDPNEPTIFDMFLVGDATPGGWSLGEQTPMLVDSENPFIFSWTGDLVPGEFKIKTYTENDWCGGDWIHPLEHGQAFQLTDFEILAGCGTEDRKWVVSEESAGSFTITVNLEEDVIIFNGDALSIDENNSIPGYYALNQNYPNPFNPSTVISFQLPVNSDVRLEVFDITGRSVSVLVDGMLASGRHDARFDASSLASGLYLYRLSAGTFSRTRKLMLIR
ncbi:MAG: SusF/SusE family outer membrane protein [Rhodothermaceae bacterium]|nr:SusF/SusE family outer membrane protein [Rhodothermaceae bacterium]